MRKLVIWGFILSTLFFLPIVPFIGATIGRHVYRKSTEPTDKTLAGAAIMIGMLFTVLHLLLGVAVYLRTGGIPTVNVFGDTLKDIFFTFNQSIIPILNNSKILIP